MSVKNSLKFYSIKIKIPHKKFCISKNTNHELTIEVVGKGIDRAVVHGKKLGQDEKFTKTVLVPLRVFTKNFRPYRLDK